MKIHFFPYLYLIASAIMSISQISNMSYAYDLKEITKNVSPSVLMLEIMDYQGKITGFGTGFCISNEGWIVTNYHVVDDAISIKAVTKTKREIEIAGIIAVNKDRDLVILKAVQTNIPPLVLYKGRKIEPGERIIVLGGPRGLAGTLSEGIVSAIRYSDEIKGEKKRKTNFELLQITAPISPGSSGSPVMNQKGEVIGVVVSQYLFGQNLNFAIPITDVANLLDTIDDDMTLQPLDIEKNLSLYADIGITLGFILIMYLVYRWLIGEPIRIWLLIRTWWKKNC